MMHDMIPYLLLTALLGLGYLASRGGSVTLAVNGEKVNRSDARNRRLEAERQRFAQERASEHANYGGLDETEQEKYQQIRARMDELKKAA